MPRSRKYPQELIDRGIHPQEWIDRGIRLVFESGRPIAAVARDPGVPAEALRKRVRRAEIDAGTREGLTGEEREDVAALAAVGLGLAHTPAHRLRVHPQIPGDLRDPPPRLQREAHPAVHQLLRILRSSCHETELPSPRLESS